MHHQWYRPRSYSPTLQGTAPKRPLLHMCDGRYGEFLLFRYFGSYDHKIIIRRINWYNDCNFFSWNLSTIKGSTARLVKKLWDSLSIFLTKFIMDFFIKLCSHRHVKKFLSPNFAQSKDMTIILIGFYINS